MGEGAFSKNQIRLLGDRIRAGQPEGVSPDDIDLLEDYRRSYKEQVSTIFNELFKESKDVRHDSITTYRLKRIESIIRKLYRFPKMELDRMWDVAGCRCILNSEDKVHKLKVRLREKFYVLKENDYYSNPSPDGYKSVHLYLTKKKGDKWPIEVQLRTRNDHNWATLVEIIDQLYGKSLKEGEQDKDFATFLMLISQLSELALKDRHKLLQLTHKLAVFKKLYSVFVQNYLRVRLHWLELKKPKNHHFFVIEVEGDQPQIASFSSFLEAEQDYFHRFNTSKGTNVVLTYLPQSNFENLETAYSNYTLTTHTFIDDYFKLLSDVCGYLMSEKKYRAFYHLFRSAQENYYSNLVSIQHESTTIQGVSEEGRVKAKYWKKDFLKRIDRRNNQLKQLSNQIEKYKPDKGMDVWVFNFYVWRINRREKRFLKEYKELFGND